MTYLNNIQKYIILNVKNVLLGLEKVFKELKDRDLRCQESKIRK